MCLTDALETLILVYVLQFVYAKMTNIKVYRKQHHIIQKKLFKTVNTIAFIGR